MSLISMYETDHSAELAKRFAALTATYLDDPKAAKDRTAKIPVANLFRILEMYRYDAFDDESRGGVVSIENLDSRSPVSHALSNWHEPILRALNGAMCDVFKLNENDDKAEAISSLQKGLRQLVGAGHVDAPVDALIRSFLSSFQQRLS